MKIFFFKNTVDFENQFLMKNLILGMGGNSYYYLYLLEWFRLPISLLRKSFYINKEGDVNNEIVESLKIKEKVSREILKGNSSLMLLFPTIRQTTHPTS